MHPYSYFISLLVSSTIAAKSIEKRATTVTNTKTPPVTVAGNSFTANGQRFYLRGVDWQPGGSSQLVDPIADVGRCQRDVNEFAKLGINTVRIYTVDNSATHDDCMKILADHGIYIALDVNGPAYSLNSEYAAATNASYNEVYLQNVFATIDMFAKYDNTLLFFAGNEVMSAWNMSYAAPYVKAVTRDMKAYMKARGYRAIPVGYSAPDLPEIHLSTIAYLNCGGDSARSDFYSYNDYSYCNTDFITAKWDQKVKNFTGYSIPIFLSEFGCIDNRPRKWPEIASLYSKNMTPVYSGGLVYEYTNETNNFGIVSINGNNVQELPEFSPLATAFRSNPPPTDGGGFNKDHAASKCPPQDFWWKISGEAIPDTPTKAQKYFKDGAGPGPGIKTGDKGSQWAGSASTSWSVPGNSIEDGGSGGKKKSTGSVVTAISPLGLLVAVLCSFSLL